MPYLPSTPVEKLPCDKSCIADDAAMDPNARINAVRTRKICGDISDPTLWRWVHDPKLKFPKPEFVNGRRYWRLAAVLKWWESQGGKGASC